MSDYIPGTRTSDTAIRKSDGEVIMKDDPNLIEKAARVMWNHEFRMAPGLRPFDDEMDEVKEHFRQSAAVAIIVALQAVEAEEINRSYDEDHRISRYLARENGIEL